MIRRLLVAALIAPVIAGAQAPSGYVPLDTSSAPVALTTAVTVKATNVALRAAIAEVARQANVSIAFDPSLPGLDRPVDFSADRISAAKALIRMLEGTPVRAMVTPSGAIVLTERPKRDETRSFVSGTIREPDGVLAGVHLILSGTRFETMSDAAGRFNFGLVPAGTYTLRALRLGFAPIARLIRVAAGENLSAIELTMTPAAVPVAAVIVTPGYVGVMQPGTARAQTLTRQQLETVPQLGEDVYRTIGRLPGVASDDFSAKFTIRGESSEGLYATLDGMPLVEPFHLRDIGSALSIVDMSALGKAELISGGPSAEYGDQIAGVFKLHTLEPRDDRARTSVGISLTNLKAMSQGGFANGKGSWLVSARQGFLELAFKLAKLDDSLNPRYNDVFAKVTYDLGGTRLGVHALRAGDRLKYLSNNEPSLNSHYVSNYAWLTTEGKVGSRLRQESVLWGNSLDWHRGGFERDQSPRDVNISDQRRLNTIGVRQDWSAELGSHALLKAGTEIVHEAATYDYSKHYGHDVSMPGMITRVMDTAVFSLSPTNDRVGVYVSQRVRPTTGLTLEAGLRYDRTSLTTEGYASPRLNASWQPTSTTTLRASWGKHVQSQSVFALQVEDLVTTFQPAERASQTSLDVEQVVGAGITLRAEGYARDIDHVRERYFTASERLYPITEVDWDRVSTSPQQARARGIELSIVRDAGGFTDWSASYVISSSTQLLDGRWLPRRNDQPRVFRGDWSFHPRNNSWRITVSGIRRSGWPYTPEIVRLDTVVHSPTSFSIYEHREPGALYSVRTAPYNRVDARWTRFIDTRTGRVSLFIDIYNVLNNDNEREKVVNVQYYQGKTLNPRFIDGARQSLPRIPSFGITWEF